MLEKLKSVFRMSMEDEDVRKELLFNLLNICLGAVALFMTVVNFFTNETVLMYVTLAFSVICAVNFVLLRFQKISRAVVVFLFLLDIMILLTHFIVSGQPAGFSVLWCLLVPACAAAIFGMHDGIIMSGVVLVDILVLFWTPVGRSWLQYEYTDTFMLRFPFVYLSIFLIALYIEAMRRALYKRLKKSEAEGRYMYRHDALTGLYNRYAFSEELEEMFKVPSGEHIAVILLDIDDFKQINDRYGHNMGDEVLRTVARMIMENTCEHCVSCRWGGEEFLVLMQCRHNPHETAEKIRKAVSKTPVTLHEQTVTLTVSAGAAVAYSLSKAQISDFINLADKAMYVSKSSGKNRTTVCNMEVRPWRAPVSNIPE